MLPGAGPDLSLGHALRNPMNRVGSSVEVVAMLWTLIVILLVLWALGLITAVGGAVIHLLLVIALIVLAVQLIGGRRVA